jgi:hypothetical protein
LELEIELIGEWAGMEKFDSSESSDVKRING